ncbi:hypothetical protein GINT2_000902 [Glugoides intestinalis]
MKITPIFILSYLQSYWCAKVVAPTEIKQLFDENMIANSTASVNAFLSFMNDKSFDDKLFRRLVLVIISATICMSLKRNKSFEKGLGIKYRIACFIYELLLHLNTKTGFLELNSTLQTLLTTLPFFIAIVFNIFDLAAIITESVNDVRDSIKARKKHGNTTLSAFASLMKDNVLQNETLSKYKSFPKKLKKNIPIILWNIARLFLFRSKDDLIGSHIAFVVSMCALIQPISSVFNQGLLFFFFVNSALKAFFY